MQGSVRYQVKEYWRTQRIKLEEQEAIIEAKRAAEEAKAAAI
jgi:hypothetical protein